MTAGDEAYDRFVAAWAAGDLLEAELALSDMKAVVEGLAVEVAELAAPRLVREAELAAAAAAAVWWWEADGPPPGLFS